MAEKDKGIEQEPHRTKLSVAMMATHRHLDEWQRQILLVHDKKTDKWGPPSGGGEIINGVSELPHETLLREWHEETTLPFDFQDRVRFLEVIVSSQKNKTSVGFIYQAELKKETVARLNDPLHITTDEDVDLVQLFDFFQIKAMLENWQNTIKIPEINTINLINWCNEIRSTASGPYSDFKYEPFTPEDFGIDFKTQSVNRLVWDIQFDSE